MSEEPAIRGVSWKALLVAAVAYALAFVFIAAVIKAAVACVLFAGYGYKAGQAFDAWRAMPVVAISGRLLSLLGAARAAGYVASRTAQTRHVLTGTLATINPILISLYVLTFSPLVRDADALSPWMPLLFALLTFIGGPVLGALGGYLAELRQVRLQSLFAEETQALPSPQPSPR
jgi:hypothetical protein